MPVRIVIQLLIDILLASVVSSAIFPHCFGRVALDDYLYDPPAIAIATFVVVMLFSSFLMDVYDRTGKPKKREIFTRVLLSSMASCLPFSLVYVIAPFLLPNKNTLLVAILLFACGQFSLNALFSIIKLPRRVLVLGTGPFAAQVADIVQSGNSNAVIVGYVACAAETAVLSRRGTGEETVPDAYTIEPIVGDAEQLTELSQQFHADSLVVALSERRGVFPVKEVLQCKMQGVEIVDVPKFYEQAYKKLMLEQITPSWFFFSEGFRRTAVFAVIKRALDILLSLIGLALTLPFFPLIVLLIKLDSPGPLFFSQVRTGLNEKTFMLYKFRTMGQDAEKGTGAVWSSQNDPRITRVGAFLRKSRIDEFPQFYNVLRGDMSFVGPRPERPEFVEKLKQVIPYYSKRHFVKPGLTGWAQVCYPYGSTVEDAIEKLRYDLYYTKNISAFLDLLIVLETIKVVLFGRGGR